MKSLLALSFLIFLTSCGDSTRARTLTAQEDTETKSTNALETKKTKKCTTEAALKMLYSEVVQMAKKNRSNTIYHIYANNSRQFNTTYTDETGTYMETAFFIEVGDEKIIYTGKLNLTTCAVVSLDGSQAQSVSEEGNQL